MPRQLKRGKKMADERDSEATVETRADSRSILAIILGIVLGIIGLVLTIGGIWLAALGGSWYYVLAGIGLLISAWFLIRSNPLGGYVYLAVFVLTLIWALWEVGLNGWALVPRVVAPAVLAVLVLLIMPLVSRRWGWAGALLGSVGVVALLGIGFAVSHDSFNDSVQPLPASLGAQMSDPSLMPVGADWPNWGGTGADRRFSPLDQITPQNVKNLKVAWTYHTGDLPQGKDEQGKWSPETTPIKVGDSIYLCSAKDIIISIDPVTGKERWRYDPKVPDAWIPYGATCRGVAYYAVPGAAANSPCAARIIEGTLDSRLIAVDARTGQPCADFGTNGQADMKAGLGPIDPSLMSMTSAPTIVDGIIIPSAQVLDNQKLDAPSGVIQGFDAKSGKRVWAWDMMHPDWSPDPPQGQMFYRGTPNLWTHAVGDEKLGLVYVPLGNAADDYYSSKRTPTEDQFASSLVALDAKTGKPRWKFQTVHMDVWDYDLGSPVSLVDFPSGSGTIPALILTSKQGQMYVLDRRTGKSLFPVQERRVPQGGVEPGQRSPTQPFSSFHSLTFPQLTEASMWGMSPIDQMYCRIQFKEASYDGPYTPPTERKRYIQLPSNNGGSDWGGFAVDPNRGIIVANYNRIANYNRLIPRSVADKKGWYPVGSPQWQKLKKEGKLPNGDARGLGQAQAGIPYAIHLIQGWKVPYTGLMCMEPPYGGITAIDMRTGKTLWNRPLGTARRNGPFGIHSALPFDIGTPNNGGAVVTASGLIFVSAATDNLFRAIDLKNGNTLWTASLPAGGQDAPITYEANGKQYVVIMAGGHHFMGTGVGDELIAYALPS
jgi:quinoprotein glucose dehydrogenase